MKRKSLAKINLLYVEDDEDIRLELNELFEKVCMNLYVAKDGEEGLEKFKEYKPDIVLTDIHMPKMNGLSMIKYIREINPDVPTVVASAFSDTEYLLEAIKKGVNHFLLKPINLLELLNTLDDIASNLVAKRELKENEKILSQYKDIVDEAEIVSKSDPKGYITYVNDKFCTISGYSREELIGKQHNIVRHEEMPASVFKEMWETILEKKSWNGIVKNRAKDGSAYYVDSTIIPILDTNDNIVEFISIRKDITKRELQREKLQNSLETSAKTLDEKISFINEFEKALTKGNTLFCRINVNGIISMASEALNKLFGYELSNTNYMDLVKIGGQARVKNIFNSNIKNNKPWKGMIDHVGRDAEEIYLQSSFTPITGIDGEVLELFCFYIDLTENVNLNKEILATQREVISTMGAIGETRSRETGAHVKRVAEYSKFLALIVGLSSEEAEELKMASPMHDIGKVGIPDSILNKPGKLTDDEFVIMKTHAELGYDMLKNSNQKLLRAAATVAHEHHERWDGSGYPNGISGTDIHIYGRITALADVFDALGHDRVYKKAWNLEDIYELIKRERGKHFDPMLVDLFFKHLDEFLAIKNSFDG